MKETISMSIKEIDRAGVFKRLVAKEIKQNQAAKILGISTRQIKRLLKKYKREGAAGLVHKLRGVKGNRAIKDEEKEKISMLISHKYHDFGPTLAWEKLTEVHGFSLSDETIRKVMIEKGLWKARQRKRVRLHQLRERRSCLGELIQADGSPHDWFEGRAPKSTLLVFIDDATGKLMHLEFVESESTKAYFTALFHYLIKHGRPVAFYVDKHGVFRVNTTKGGSADTSDSNGITQFGRAMEELSIGVIFADTAQAKGRVEKTNRTLQDRLVKEMRLREIKSWEEGNAFLAEFMEIYNKKFAVVPKSPSNMHRPLLSSQHLENILCLKYQRTLSKQLTLSYGNKIYQIKTERPTYALRHARVTIEDREGTAVRITYKGKELAYSVITLRPKAEIIDSKNLNRAVDRLSKQIGIPITITENIPWKPAANHPWRQFRAA